MGENTSPGDPTEPGREKPSPDLPAHHAASSAGGVAPGEQQRYSFSFYLRNPGSPLVIFAAIRVVPADFLAPLLRHAPV